MSDVSEERAREIMAVTKYCDASLEWAERKNHAGSLMAVSQVEDDTGALIPGLTIQLEMKRPIVVDRCYYDLGLFLLDAGVRRRVYQLNVTPLDKRSHNGVNQVLFGPHEHIGALVVGVTAPGIQCGEIHAAFAFYSQRINLRFTGTLGSPL